MALSACKDRRLATDVLLATTALACFLALSGRWTGSRADILWVIDQLQAAMDFGADSAADGVN